MRSTESKAAPAAAKRGGARPGAGPKPKSPTGEKMIVLAIRVTPPQAARYRAADGAADKVRAFLDTL